MRVMHCRPQTVWIKRQRALFLHFELVTEKHQQPSKGYVEKKNTKIIEMLKNDYEQLNQPREN